MTEITDFDLLNSQLEGTTLLEASAGTGKTWNICGLYLRLLLEKKLEVQQILVVTFTNAATAELRDRIRKRIVEMHNHLSGNFDEQPDEFIESLTKKLRSSDDDKALANRLELALQSFDEAAIFTIHGFCQRALADAAFAAGQPFSLELMPEDSELLLEAVHDYWRKNIASENMSSELATFLLQKKDSPEKYAKLLKRHLAKPLAKVEWPENDPKTIDSGRLDATYNDAKVCWETNRNQVVELLNISLPILNNAIYKTQTIQSSARDYDELFKHEAPLEGKAKDTKLHLMCASTLKIRTKGQNTPPEHHFFEATENYFSQREAFEKNLEIARIQLIRHMLQETSESLPRRKREKRLQSFDDLLNNLHTALSNGDFPWLAETLRLRYPAALIDEFQDTDPLQFAIFSQIYENASTKSLFFVGDPKQAIYSFRNADLETYFHARKQTTAIYSIRKNQRSTRGLIDAVNRVFSANPNAFMHDDLDFQNAGYGRKADAVLADHSANHADLQLWMLPKNEEGEYIERRTAMQQAANATAAEISRLLGAASRSEITLDEQPLLAGDIAVLVRSHAQGRRIRQALARLEVGSVELSQESVFKSADAEEVERVLTAIWFPARLATLRSALATELLGYDAAAIVRISDDENKVMQLTQTFAAYRELWLKHGIAYVYRHVLSDQKVSQRMLPRTDGERRMTNLLHLGELLQQAAELHPAPDATLRWLQTQRREDGANEAAQLRLESDQNLVKIMTIHKSKGLQFAVVFCPFLWDGYRNNRNDLEGREYHDRDGHTVIDYRPETNNEDATRDRIRYESDAEDLRLMYVALTRAVYRCYLVAGCYARPSYGESTRSLLNWLVAGVGATPMQWRETPKYKNSEARKQAETIKTEQIERAWQQMTESGNGIRLQALPAGSGKPLNISNAGEDELAYQKLPKMSLTGWRISSYSGLSRGAVHESAASDHDSFVLSEPENEPSSIPDDDILRFPKGASAGDCIHKAFELCDFSQPLSYEMAIERALAAHPQTQLDLDLMNVTELKAMLRNMMEDVLHTRLQNGIRLCDVIPQKRLAEMGFHLSRAHLSDRVLNQTLQSLGYTVPHLHFGRLDGYLKGFIDLIFEHDGRYYILDWKSNYLGNAQSDYGPRNIEEAMNSNGYHLQYLLYAVALHRHLARCLPAYQYDTHFGGVLYLFVRGVRPDWQNSDGTPCGVFYEKPRKNAIHQLNNLFNTCAMKAA